jgi:hypothetical protein
MFDLNKLFGAKRTERLESRLLQKRAFERNSLPLKMYVHYHNHALNLRPC